MPDYQHVIAVDGNDFKEIIESFGSLVQSKVLEPVPYKDYTRLKKFNKDVEFRFAPNDGAVMIVPVETGLSLLYWTKKGDNSFGDFLWDYFREELKDMHENNETKEYYDIWGLAKADNCSTCSAADKTTISTWVGDPYYSDAQTAISAISYEHQDIAKVKETVEILQDKIKTLESELAEKANQEELNYLHDRINNEASDIRAHVNNVKDEVYTCQTYVDENTMRIRDLEYAEDERRLREREPKEAGCTVVAPQSTSSNVYRKNYKVNFADFGADERKEKENMDTSKMFNGFEFGPVDDRIKMSPYGMAIRNADGRYVSYDAKSGNIMDVEVFNFDNHKLIWKMPVAVSAIAVGDTVIHMKKPMFVTSITNGITVIDIFNGEVKTIVPSKNLFNFNYITKVVSLFNFTGDNAPTADNPFGNVMPFMLMNNEHEDMDMKDFFLMMAVANGGNMNTMFQNPLMLYAMMNGEGDMKEMLPFLMMGQSGLFGGAPANTCNCGGNCGQHNQ